MAEDIKTTNNKKETTKVVRANVVINQLESIPTCVKAKETVSKARSKHL